MVNITCFPFIYLELTLYVFIRARRKAKETARHLYKRPLLLNGSLVLGQETDDVNGDFNPMQSYSGWVADFR